MGIEVILNDKQDSEKITSERKREKKDIERNEKAKYCLIHIERGSHLVSKRRRTRLSSRHFSICFT